MSLSSTLIFAPHYDDAVLSLGGAMRTGQLGKTKVVVVFSTTDYAFGASKGAFNITLRRQLEESNVLRLLQCDLQSLGFPEWRLREHTGGEFLDGFQMQVESIIRICMSEYPASLALFPLGIGNHPDHMALSAIGSRLIEIRSIGFYEDLPYAAARDSVSSGPSWMRRLILASSFDTKRRFLRHYRSQALFTYFEALENYHSGIGGEAIYVEKNPCFHTV